MTGPPGRAALDAVSRARKANPVSLLLVEAGSGINSFSRTLKRRSPE